MADDSTSSSSTDTPTDQPAATAADIDPADLGDAGKKALAAERARAKQAEKQAADLAARLKEFEDRDKTEAQKLEERATAAERRAAENEQALMRMRVAASKGLPADLVDRLRGADEKELEADADALLALVRPARRGSVDQGLRGAAVQTDGKARAAAALRELRGTRL